MPATETVAICVRSEAITARKVTGSAAIAISSTVRSDPKYAPPTIATAATKPT